MGIPNRFKIGCFSVRSRDRLPYIGDIMKNLPWKAAFIAFAFSVFFVGCGAVDRSLAKFTGDATETCHDGVMYLQFTSGASVAYNKDGTVKTCD